MRRSLNLEICRARSFRLFYVYVEIDWASVSRDWVNHPKDHVMGAQVNVVIALGGYQYSLAADSEKSKIDIDPARTWFNSLRIDDFIESVLWRTTDVKTIAFTMLRRVQPAHTVLKMIKCLRCWLSCSSLCSHIQKVSEYNLCVYAWIFDIEICILRNNFSRPKRSLNTDREWLLHKPWIPKNRTESKIA